MNFKILHIIFRTIIIELKRKPNSLVTVKVRRTIPHYLLGTSQKTFSDLGIATFLALAQSLPGTHQVKNYSLLPTLTSLCSCSCCFLSECPFLTVCLYLSFREQQLKYCLLSVHFADLMGITNWFIIKVLSALLTHLHHNT